ncbi:phage tail tape measure protein [Agrobacterium sp. CNPSo 2736]|uniref:phage tail tape measure protein n=1 Tax=Agrobacterium sp. CNPSo 2736 TaxID=2499627 RepID=UPI000FDA84D5|nr:phage tail tape measure protein [Agrobacterium sp. CNPSo 2736]RVT80222.1 phage tail tape measure protein [Agrobacterium sp. CNPSo 2736]
MSSAVIGALRVNLGIDTAEFRDGFADLQKTLGRVGKSMESLGKKLSVGLTAPITAFGVLTVRTAGDFEAAMNRVGAATSATSDQLAQMEALARELGKSTSKSASESADMLEMLAKNGMSVEEIMGGAAEAAIKLSEATGGDLSRSADVATNVMAQFGLEAKEMARVVDQITSVTLASQFGFDDYALALGQAGGVAGALGVSLTDFNAVMASTSDVFNSGSDAGTSFKTFLTRLVPQSKPAAEAMKELGLEFFDAQGNMKSMADVAQELKEGLSGLSDEARTSALQQIFGQDAMRTAVAMASQGSAGIEAAIAQINKVGIAQEQADARMKGFNGEMEKLSGAFEELQIAIAKSGLLEMITGFVAGLAEWVGWLAQVNPELLKWGTIIAAVAAAMGPIIAAIGMFATAVAAISAPVLAAIAVVSALAAAAIYLYQNWENIRESFPLVGQIVETTVAVMSASLSGFLENARLLATGVAQLLTGDFAGAWNTARELVHNFWQTLANVMDAIFPGLLASVQAKMGEIVSAVQTVAAKIPEAFAMLPSHMLQIGKDIMNGLLNGITGAASSVIDGVKGVATNIVDGVKSVLDIHSPSRVMQDIGTNVMQGLNNGMTNFSGTVVDTATGVASTVTGAFSQMESIGDKLSSSLSSAFKGVLDGSKTVREAISGVLGSLADMWMNQAFQALFGGGIAGSSGGIFGTLFGGIGKLFGFANGGSFQVGGAGGVDSQLVAFKASPNERVTVTKPGQEGHSGRGGGTMRVVVGIDPKNGSIQPYVDSSIQQAAPAIQSGAVGQANRMAPGAMANYQATRAGGDYRNG